MSLRKAGHGAFVFVFVAVLVDSIGFGIILPVLPRLIMQLTGVSVDRAAVYGGWLSFVYALLQFFCAPVLGNLSDRFGRRPVLLFALLALGCDYLVMGFAPVIAWLFVGRMVAGVAGDRKSTRLNSSHDQISYAVFCLKKKKKKTQKNNITRQ